MHVHQPRCRLHGQRDRSRQTQASRRCIQPTSESGSMTSTTTQASYDCGPSGSSVPVPKRVADRSLLATCVATRPRSDHRYRVRQSVVTEQRDRPSPQRDVSHTARRAPPNRTATPQSLQGHTSAAEARVAERSGDATPTSALYVRDYDASPSWRKPRSGSQFWSSDPRSRTGEQSPSLLPVADSMSIPSPGITGPKTAPAGYPKRAFPNESTNPPRRAILMSQRGYLHNERGPGTLGGWRITTCWRSISMVRSDG